MKSGNLLKKVLIVIVIFFLIVIGRKIIIISKLNNISKEYTNKTNYIKISSYIQRDKIITNKSYNKDDNFLEEEELYDIKNNTKFITTSYKNGDDTLRIIQNGENKEVEYEIYGKKGSIWSVHSMCENLNVKDLILGMLKIKITTDYVDSKECYLIKLENDALVWVDKDTGLDLRFSNGVGITEIVYEFNTVTDADIIKPQI